MGKPQNDTQEIKVCSAPVLDEDFQEMANDMGQIAKLAKDSGETELSEKVIKLQQALASFTSEDLRRIDEFADQLAEKGEISHDSLEGEQE